MAITLAIGIYSVINSMLDIHDCRETGGVPVRGLWSWECMR